MKTVFNKLFGTRNERVLKRFWPRVVEINDLESSVSELSDDALRARTDEFRHRLETGDSVDDLLPEAFAVVRESARRQVGMRHFDVQMVGGIVLHEGMISEMKTGEGKTLVATLPLYLNALTGKGAHLVTVNDYLAKRDAQWMAPIFHALGLTVGIIQHDNSFLYDPTFENPDPRMACLKPVSRREGYAADITYGTNNEFGFDFLRDNMALEPSQRVQRPLHFGIVDEVDSILIDESRTPLIISGPSEESTDLYKRIDRIIPSLKAESDFTIEEKTKTVALTDEGNSKVERLLNVDNLYDLSNISLVHHVHQGLRAHALFKRDVDYVVKDGEVVIVDEFTGRMMPGRRWSDGLHQAVEAMENVKIASENQTLATVTFQNYFRIYSKLAGMTGTADTEAAEFSKIYHLEVVVIPPNMTMIRTDYADVVYRTEGEKFNAIVQDISEGHKQEQPVLVGTISIEKSERLSALLKKQGIPHAVLNAKFHEKEAEIISQAGRSGAVTIATNMAGRGTDIVLGGSPQFMFKKVQQQRPNLTEAESQQIYRDIEEECEKQKEHVIACGGLHIIGTERHESRRIDNQLRGRSGRQGDPGSSRFYLSLEDDLMRIFGSERISGLMERLGMEEGVPIEHRMVSRAIENAQKKVEAHHFDVRKQLLEYDDVMNKQREVIYAQRVHVLGEENLEEDLQDEIQNMVQDLVENLVGQYCSEDVYPEAWDIPGLCEVFHTQFSLKLDEDSLPFREMGTEAIREDLLRKVHEAYQLKETELETETLRRVEKMVMLRTIDFQWKDHLLSMDHLKEGIGLRGYGQKDPLAEYKREGYDMFSSMMDRIASDTVSHLFRIQTVREKPALPRRGTLPSGLITNRSPEDSKSRDTVQSVSKKVGRNAPCPCGSGKKYKKCCGL